MRKLFAKLLIFPYGEVSFLFNAVNWGGGEYIRFQSSGCELASLAVLHLVSIYRTDMATCSF